MLSVIVASALLPIMLGAVGLSVVIPNVVAPQKWVIIYRLKPQKNKG